MAGGGDAVWTGVGLTLRIVREEAVERAAKVEFWEETMSGGVGDRGEAGRGAAK